MDKSPWTKFRTTPRGRETGLAIAKEVNFNGNPHGPTGACFYDDFVRLVYMGPKIQEQTTQCMRYQSGRGRRGGSTEEMILEVPLGVVARGQIENDSNES